MTPTPDIPLAGTEISCSGVRSVMLPEPSSSKSRLNCSKADVPVGRYLADQLMIPMALAGGGTFRTLPLTRHSTTNIEILKEFLDVEASVNKLDRKCYEVEITPR